MKIEQLPIEKIKRAKYNPRVQLKPGDPAYDHMVKGLEKFGLVKPLVWNKKTGNLIEGHQRLTWLEGRGDKIITVSVVNLSLRDEKELNLGLNKLGGEWDDALLTELLSDLSSFEGFDPEVAGWSQDELTELLDDPDVILNNAGTMGAYEYRILVSCDSEEHQARLLAQFEKESLRCKALVS